MPKISVIIPVYNTEKHLRECLDSVVNQTFKDIEIICVDDGSTDNSLNILNKYATKDKRIKVISQENSGHSAARNTGLKYITGELCYFLDSDDYIDSRLLEYAVKIFNNFDIDYFCFGAEAFTKSRQLTQSINELNNYLKVKYDGLFDLNFDIASNINIHIWNKVFKSSLIKKHNISFVNKLIYEDIYFMWYYNFVSHKVYFESEKFYHYRITETSTMETMTKYKNFTALHHMYNWHNLIETISNDSELFIKNYNNLLSLLELYANRTKEMIPLQDKYKVELLKLEYKKEIENIYLNLNLNTESQSLLDNIFSVKTKQNNRIILSLFGLKITFKRNK